MYEKMSKLIHNKSRGFTLIELVIVIGILAVLAGVAIRAFSGQGEGARNSQHVGYLTQLDAAGTEYMSKYGVGDLSKFTEVNESHPLVELGFTKAAVNPWKDTAEEWKAYKYYLGVVEMNKTVGGVTKIVPKVVVVLGEESIIAAEKIAAGKDYLQMDVNSPKIVQTVDDKAENIVNTK